MMRANSKNTEYGRRNRVNFFKFYSMLLALSFDFVCFKNSLCDENGYITSLSVLVT